MEVADHLAEGDRVRGLGAEVVALGALHACREPGDARGFVVGQICEAADVPLDRRHDPARDRRRSGDAEEQNPVRAHEGATDGDDTARDDLADLAGFAGLACDAGFGFARHGAQDATAMLRTIRR